MTRKAVVLVMVALAGFLLTAEGDHRLRYAAAELAGRQPGSILHVEFINRYHPWQIEEAGAWLFERTAQPAAHNSVDHYLIHFVSTDVDGSRQPARAQVFVPVLDGRQERPVLVFAAGTTGVSEKCAPIIEDPVLNRWGDFRTNMLAYGARGIIAIFPEYLGFGIDAIPQRYFSKVAEGQVMLDAARALKNFFGQSGLPGYASPVRPAEALFFGGYSQGGHAAHAAADLRARYAPEISIKGLIGFGQTNDVAMLMREMAYYSPYIIYTYAQIYGYDVINPADYLQPQWLETFEADIMGLCVEEFQHHYPGDGRGLFTPAFYRALHADVDGRQLAIDFPDMARVLRENRAGFDGHGLPSLVLHGQLDTIVGVAAQNRFVDALRRGGSEVSYIIMPGIRHRDTRQAGFEESVSWILKLHAR